jgi:hypothetical protein
MPQLLQDFELARSSRLWDGIGLWHLNRDHGSVYLLGYHAEMTLKCAYFTFAGHAPNSRVERPELNTALGRARQLGVVTNPKGFHSLRFWADLLVADRAACRRALPAGAAAGLLRHAGTIELHWSVEMRYQARSVTRASLELVSASVDWLDRQYDTLAR